MSLRRFGRWILPPPEAQIAKGEEVVGEVRSDDLRKLWTLRRRSHERLQKTIKSLLHAAIDEPPTNKDQGKDNDPEKYPHCRLRMDVALAEERFKLLDTLFWGAIRHGISEKALAKVLFFGNNIGIAKDWQIVVSKSSRSSLPDFLLHFHL